jgi:short-subunit dehydrogenase
MSESHPYRGRVVVITGASSGFGRGTALELAERGASVVLAARSVDLLEQIALACETAGGEALVAPTDVSDSAQVEQLAAKTLERFGRFDCWINNAGVGAIGQFDDIPLADHEQVIRTGLIGTIAGSHCALRHFRRRGHGVLINVASVVGKIPAPLYASYVAAKFGVVGLSDAIRQELREQSVTDIRVCTVMPMSHETEFFQHAANYTGHESKPIPPVYDPAVTIDALVKLVVEPDDETITGWQGGVFNVLHHLMPGAVEKLMAKRSMQAELEDSPPAPNTAGAVHHPA